MLIPLRVSWGLLGATVFTDGFHGPTRERSGLSFCTLEDGVDYSVRLSGVMPVESCKLYVILSAFKHFERCPGLSSIVLVSDARNSQRDTKGRFTVLNQHLIIVKIVHLSLDLIRKDKLVLFSWIPYHLGIESNERPDIWAREALGMTVGNFVGTPMRDFITLFR